MIAYVKNVVQEKNVGDMAFVHKELFDHIENGMKEAFRAR